MQQLSQDVAETTTTYQSLIQNKIKIKEEVMANNRHRKNKTNYKRPHTKTDWSQHTQKDIKKQCRT